ncbi:DUF397 domain-containing protein [Actinomadura verrucosospora]|uniref:DUF397 domain-containing protein n=1 Tax=Actinomadura verrucosospora TaxID=46165 RepID=A0A7D3VYQ5_ACTVE|nr:DUF397 domain-containing protein [Actinomadura verrucosospora]QKG24314.1 hypothetical protein ACTIVE_5957 [Actinomadura verrucosospora]
MTPSHGPFNHATKRWRKSTYSNNGGSCIEVAALDSTRLIRDSKDPEGPVLAVSFNDWTLLLTFIKINSGSP